MSWNCCAESLYSQLHYITSLPLFHHFFDTIILGQTTKTDAENWYS